MTETSDPPSPETGVRSGVRGPVGAVIGILVALFAATLGAIGGNVAGWNTAADIPDDSTVEGMFQQAFPDTDGEISGYRELFKWEDMNGRPQDGWFMFDGGDDLSAGYLEYIVDFRDDQDESVAEAEERLKADGWNIDSSEGDEYGREFVASRDGLSLEVYSWTDPGSNGGSQILLQRTTPSAVPVLTVVGLVVGAVAGWMLTSGMLRRAALVADRMRVAVAGMLGLVSALLLVFPVVITWALLFVSLIYPDDRVAPWRGYTDGPFAIAALAGTAALLIAALCATLPTRNRASGMDVADPEDEVPRD